MTLEVLRTRVNRGKNLIVARKRGHYFTHCLARRRSPEVSIDTVEHVKYLYKCVRLRRNHLCYRITLAVMQALFSRNSFFKYLSFQPRTIIATIIIQLPRNNISTPFLGFVIVEPPELLFNRAVLALKPSIRYTKLIFLNLTSDRYPLLSLKKITLQLLINVGPHPAAFNITMVK